MIDQGDVQVVGQRDVDGVEVGVGEQGFVGTVGFCDVVISCRGLRLGKVARGDGRRSQ